MEETNDNMQKGVDSRHTRYDSQDGKEKRVNFQFYVPLSVQAVLLLNALIRFVAGQVFISQGDKLSVRYGMDRVICAAAG